MKNNRIIKINIWNPFLKLSFDLREHNVCRSKIGETKTKSKISQNSYTSPTECEFNWN